LVELEGFTLIHAYLAVSGPGISHRVGFTYTLVLCYVSSFILFRSCYVSHRKITCLKTQN
jgi:hypothetical protein